MSDDTRSFNGQERTWAPYSGSASDKYWEREKTVIGRVVNDVIDTARELASNVRMNLSDPTPQERHVHRSVIDENRLEKADWRARFDKTGVMMTAEELTMDRQATAEYDRYSLAQATSEARSIWGDTRKADIERTIPTPKEWEPSAELNAVMRLSGDRTNAGAMPEAANDGIHLLKPITAEAIKDALFGPAPTGAMAEAIERLRSFHEHNAKLSAAADHWQGNVENVQERYRVAPGGGELPVDYGTKEAAFGAYQKAVDAGWKDATVLTIDQKGFATHQLAGSHDYEKGYVGPAQQEVRSARFNAKSIENDPIEPVISVVSSNFGVVARQNFPDGVAYARLADGAWTQSAGHPSPFVPVSKYDVPERFKSAVEDYMRDDMQPKEERQQKSQQYWERLAQTGANETAKDVQAQQVKDAEKKQTTMRL